jgi:hypothetical protein
MIPERFTKSEEILLDYWHGLLKDAWNKKQDDIKVRLGEDNEHYLRYDTQTFKN